MIYLTGDTHIPYDVNKLQFVPNDAEYLIVCGDFGLIWELSPSILEKTWIKYFDEQKYKLLFVDGNHENHHRLNCYPSQLWQGGKIHRISRNVYHLMRGQVFNLNGKKFFTMGGASSIDRKYRSKGLTWWAEELPCFEEHTEAVNNLEACFNTVDFVITHCLPTKFLSEVLIPNHRIEVDSLNNFLDMVYDNINFKKWYCGHYHTDLVLNDKVEILYNKIVPLAEV